MSRLAQLRADLAEALSEMENLADSGFDEESRAVFDERAAEAKRLKEDIARLEEYEEARKHVPNPDLDQTEGRVSIIEEPEDRRFKSFGEQLIAVHRAAVGAYVDPRLCVVGENGEKRAVLGANEGVPSDGGFLVQPEFSAEVFKIAHDTASFLPRCQQTTLAGNRYSMNVVAETSRATGSRWGGVQAYWLAEGAAPTAKKVKYAQLEWKLKKLGALCYVTDEQLEDAEAVGQDATRAFGEEIAFFIDDAIFRGTGASQPLGITNANCFLSISGETGQTATTVVLENLTNMWTRLHFRSVPNSVWLINQDVLPQLFNMTLAVGTGGVPVYMPPGGASAAPYGTIYGRPVLINEFSNTMGSANDIVLADFSQYKVVNKSGGLRAAQSAHVQFTTDQMAYRFIYRIDGAPLWYSTLTPYKGSNTQSPFIGLAART